MFVRIWAIIGATLIVGFSSLVIHYNQGQISLQRQCMERRGNWETRENSGEIGCRFR